jgi:hypothetical protein
MGKLRIEQSHSKLKIVGVILPMDVQGAQFEVAEDRGKRRHAQTQNQCAYAPDRNLSVFVQTTSFVEAIMAM